MPTVKVQSLFGWEGDENVTVNNVSILNDLHVDGVSTFGDNISAAKNLIVYGALQTVGATLLQGDVTVEQDLGVDGTLTCGAITTGSLQGDNFLGRDTRLGVYKTALRPGYSNTNFEVAPHYSFRESYSGLLAATTYITFGRQLKIDPYVIWDIDVQIFNIYDETSYYNDYFKLRYTHWNGGSDDWYEFLHIVSRSTNDITPSLYTINGNTGLKLTFNPSRLIGYVSAVYTCVDYNYSCSAWHSWLPTDTFLDA
jgi:hypothetical protein